MLNLLGCSKDNFVKLIQNMKYKSYVKDKEIYFQYNPPKEKTKRMFIKKDTADSPFQVLKDINFNQ